MDPAMFVFGALLFFGWLVASLCVMTYASNRGLSGGTYFAASFFLSPAVGFIAAAAARPNLKPELAKECPDCAETVHAKARKCRFCGFAFPEKAA